MLTAITNYGPFGPVVGYAGAIMATGAALFLLWGGKMEKWRPPDEDLPGGAQALVLLLCGAGMVLQWYFASPDAIGRFVAAFGVLSLATVMCFMKYTSLLGKYTYIKKVAIGPESTENVRVLGGRDLLPVAESKLKELGITIQDLFEGAAFDADRLWSRDSRQWVKQRVLLFFILTLVSGTAALTGASFATQVLLTKKAPASVIRTKDAPGLP